MILTSRPIRITDIQPRGQYSHQTVNQWYGGVGSNIVLLTPPCKLNALWLVKLQKKLCALRNSLSGNRSRWCKARNTLCGGIANYEGI